MYDGFIGISFRLQMYENILTKRSLERIFTLNSIYLPCAELADQSTTETHFKFQIKKRRCLSGAA
jgi:hypothetical protein